MFGDVVYTMESLPYILPIVMLTFAIGLAVAVKMLSIKSIIGGCTIGALSLFMIGCSVFMMIISSGFEAKLLVKDQEIADMVDWKYKHMDELSLIIGQQRIPDDEHVALIKQLNSYGWQINNYSIQLLKDAHQALETLKQENGVARTRYLLKGVPSSVDRKLVEMGLRNVGFRIVPFKEQEEVPENANALYFGQNVDIDSIKMAALTLMQAGIELKSIKAFPKPTRGNVRAIKLDWSKYFDTRQPLTVVAVVESKGFK
ncbi:MAG: hypothetical protein KUG73_15165 [Pseudomonadales bacterium]|nr:hypothetical protein [Pseudomonadales bacterium]